MENHWLGVDPDPGESPVTDRPERILIPDGECAFALPVARALCRFEKRKPSVYVITARNYSYVKYSRYASALFVPV